MPSLSSRPCKIDGRERLPKRILDEDGSFGNRFLHSRRMGLPEALYGIQSRFSMHNDEM
jgi:hypothetical protein